MLSSNFRLENWEPSLTFVWRIVIRKERPSVVHNFSAMKMSSIRYTCGLVAFVSLFFFVVSDDSQAGGQHNLLHDSKVTHDKE